MTQNIDVKGGSSFILAAGGSLYGTTHDLITSGNSTIDLYGPCTFQKIRNGLTNGSNGSNGSILNIYNTIEVTAKIQFYAGTTNLDGGYLYLPTGNFDVRSNATFNVLNGSKLELFGGNISNDGHIFICSDCCLTTVGNWSNDANGTITGSGSATASGGNMTNLNVFSAAITWCSNV